MIEIKSINTQNNQLTNEINIDNWKNYLSNKNILDDFDFDKKYLCQGYFTIFEREHIINNKADRISQNAYDEILNKFYQGNYEIKFMAQHETEKSPLGKILGLKKDEKGVKFLAWGFREAKDEKGQYYSDLINEILLDISFSYSVENAFETKENDVLVRNIQKIADIDEISVVSFPRHKKSKIDGFKNEKFPSLDNVDIIIKEKPMKMCGTSRIRKALMKAEGISSDIANMFIKEYNIEKNNNFLSKQNNKKELLLLQEIYNLKKQINEIQEQKNNIKIEDDNSLDFLIEENKNTESENDLVNELGLL